MIRVFLSHAHSDWGQLEPLVRALEAQQCEVWHSERDIPIGDAFQDQIVQALQKCDWVLVATSVTAAQSQWVKSEVHIALTIKPERMIVINLDTHPTFYIHLHLPRLNHIPLDPRPSALAATISQRMGGEAIVAPTANRDVELLREWETPAELIPQVQDLARSTRSLDDCCHRVITSSNALLHQHTFALLSRMPPHLHEQERQWVLLPPGSVFYAGTTITLPAPCYITQHVLERSAWEALPGKQAKDDQFPEGLSVKWTLEWMRAMQTRTARDISLPDRAQLLFGLLTGLIEPYTDGEEYCLIHDPQTLERRFSICRIASGADRIWQLLDIRNPLAERSQASFRMVRI